MKKIIHLLFLSWVAFSIQAQCDPEVSKIVDQLQSKIDQQPAYEIDFSIEMNYVGEPASVQKGKMQIQEDQFKLVLQDQSIISNGKDLWIYLPTEKEVQILSLSDQSELKDLSPIHLLQVYCSEDYLSHSLGSSIVNGKNVEQIEFTPKDKSEEMFKVRVHFDPKKKEITEVKTFNKDGSRITILAENYDFHTTFASNHFNFSVQDHPGIHVEDMR